MTDRPHPLRVPPPRPPVDEPRSARNGDTPPSMEAVSGEQMREHLARGDASLVLEQINRAVSRHDYNNELIAAQVDTLILDSRDYRMKIDGIRRELRALRAYTVRLEGDSKRRAEESKKRDEAIAGDVSEVKGTVLALDAKIGQPPQKLNERASQQGELTKEELEALEQGTGLAGVIGRNTAGQKRLERRVSLLGVLGGAAGTSPVWAPQLFDLLAKLIGGH